MTNTRGPWNAMTLKPGALLMLNMAYHAMSPCDRRDMVKRRYQIKRIEQQSIVFKEKDFIKVLSGYSHKFRVMIINILIKECGLDKNEIWEG